MPELAEVERARRQLFALARGMRISAVETTEDTIVYSGVSHASFATSCQGKTVLDVKRKGKNFYMILDTPPHPIFHFGMSGSSMVKGTRGPTYRVGRGPDDASMWPPKYVKAAFSFVDGNGDGVGDWAFCDARRLGRIKLVDAADPLHLPPLSLLGDDPYLNMPSIEVLAVALAKRKAPIKAVLLDQNKPLCGLGNWMVDEILYQSRIHPSHPASILTLEEVTTLHAQILHVTLAACAANANSKLFPPHWLFRARWSKGKKGGKEFTLPDGSNTMVTFETVGGRTSAIIDALQKLPQDVKDKLEEAKRMRDLKKAEKGGTKGRGKGQAVNEESEEEGGYGDEDASEEGGDSKKGITSPYFKRTQPVEFEDGESESEESTKPVVSSRSKRGKRRTGSS